MYKFFIFILVSTISFTTLANPTIRAISTPKYFPPTPYSKIGINAYNASTVRGAVSVAGRFAVATLNPSSPLALAKQLARANPYAIAAMAASIYFQDEIGQWLEPPTETGERPQAPPKSEPIFGGNCTSYQTGLSPGAMSMQECKSNLSAEDSRPRYAEDTIELKWPSSVEYEIKVQICSARVVNGVNDPCATYTVGSLGTFVQKTTVIGYSTECPHEEHPAFIIPVDPDGDGEIDYCLNPAHQDGYQAKPVGFEDIAQPYADDLMEYHNTSIDLLQNWNPDPASSVDSQWQPYVIGSSDIVEPEFISSYNQPSGVSNTANDYMIYVSSGDFQTSNPSGANYVPPEMVQPIQTAITSVFNNSPFIDPTTGTISSPVTSTDGAATPAPVPTGSATNPINVTGDINVNVTIPEDDTISQAEYEESNAKDYQDFDLTAQLEKSKIDESISGLETADSNFIDSLTPDITNFAVPDFPTLATIWPSFTTGVCAGFSLNTSIAGNQKSIMFDAHCPPYNTYIHPLLVWILYMMTGLYVFHLASQTLGRK
jgi:hypothetical protein